MADAEGRTECGSCREPIRPGALKCPHCRTLQSKAAAWSIRLAPLLLILLPVVFVGLALRREFSNPPDFALGRERLKVVQSTAHYADAGAKCGPTISVVGTIRNDGDIPLKDVFIEVRHFDSAGALIDAEGEQDYSKVFPPGSEVAFRVSSQAVRAAADYSSHRVTIISAEDARSAF